MELREIEIFLALADELHFGRTAERLHVSQSRVSQVIRTLEDGVGGQLFERTSRRVRLTPLGTMLRDELAAPTAEIKQAVARSRSRARGPVGALSIAALHLAAAGPRFQDLMRAFRARYPACEVTLFEAFPGEALNRVRSGELDLLAHWLPLDQPDLVVGPRLGREPRALAVPAGHPLVARGWACAEDLGDLLLFDASGVVPPETADAIAPGRTSTGRPISRGPREGRMAEVLAQVAGGEAVYPTIASLTDYYSHPGVVLIELRDLAPLESALVWSASRENPAIRAFVDLAAELVPGDPHVG